MSPCVRVLLSESSCLSLGSPCTQRIPTPIPRNAATPPPTPTLWCVRDGPSRRGGPSLVGAVRASYVSFMGSGLGWGGLRHCRSGRGCVAAERRGVVEAERRGSMRWRRLDVAHVADVGCRRVHMAGCPFVGRVRCPARRDCGSWVQACAACCVGVSNIGIPRARVHTYTNSPPLPSSSFLVRASHEIMGRRRTKGGLKPSPCVASALIPSP